MDARLEALTAEKALVAADQSSFLPMIIGFVSSTFVAAGGFLVLNQQDDSTVPERVRLAAAEVPLSPVGSWVLEQTQASTVKDWMWGLVALVPILFTSFAIVQAGRSVVRQYYIRYLEREILDLADPGWRQRYRLPLGAAFESVNAAYEGNRRGDTGPRMIMTTLYVAVSATLVFAAGLALFRMDSGGWRLAFAAIYAVIALPAAATAHSAFFRGRALWQRVRKRATRELKRTLGDPARRSPDRSLGRYLLMPRPNDFIIKAVLLHGVATAFGIVLLRVREPARFNLSHGLRSGAALIIGFEFLVYQARYMLNDWRGRHSDADHFASVTRARVRNLHRLRRARLFWLGLVVRLVVGAVLPFLLLPVRRAGLVLALCGAAWGAAWIYESLRSRTVVRATESKPSLLLRSLPLHLFVGVSYGLRAAAGLWFGTDGLIADGVLVVLGIGFYLVGVMSVTMAWALEGATGTRLLDGTLHVHRALFKDKSHVVALGVVAKSLSGPNWPTTESDDCDEDLPYIAERTGLRSIWNVAAVAAAAVCGAGGAALTSWPAEFDGLAIAGGMVGAAAGLVAVCSTGVRALSLLVLAAATAALVADRGPTALFGAAAPVLAIVTYLQIRALSYSRTVSYLRELAAMWAGAQANAAKVLRELRR